MRGMLNISIKTTHKKEEILTALRTNREEHVKILEEADEGWRKKVKELLESKLVALAELPKGKLVAVSVSVDAPKSYLKVYDTAISMLESHTGADVELDADTYQQLVLNVWDWYEQWLTQNSHYSTSARMKLG